MTTSTPGEGEVTTQLRTALHAQISKAVIGQTQLVDAMLASLTLGGHLLLEGPPGVAKTLLAAALGRACGLEMRRVQFTPDLLPSDLTGTLTLRGSELAFRQGPIFTNVLLADEINRTPPKTQAALLEAMQESQVTIDGVAHQLPQPFIVLATENPIEYEGTYPLPEAQLDRFLMKLNVGYPTAQEEETLLKLKHSGTSSASLDEIQPIADASLIAAARAEVDAVTTSDALISYVASIVRKTRELPSVSLGASPRAAVHLLAASKAWARLSGRGFVIPEDVVSLVPAVLRHRILLTPEAELDHFTPDQVLRTVISSVPIPR